MSQHVAVVGAGIAGMCTALALSKQGHRITVLERDHPPPEGNADQAFFEWQRRGAAQFRHPHAFLGLMCSLLEEQHPELLEDFFRAGARRVNFDEIVPPHLQTQYAPEAGDEKLWILLCRRATLETVLRHHVESQGNVTIKNTTYVTGIETTSDPLTLTGLQLTDRTNDNARSVFEADVYIDAAGRASKFRQWFNGLGANITEERDDAEIVYYTRHYRLKPGVEEPNRHENPPAAGDLGYMKFGVFPGDGGHFALIICLPNGESELRSAVKSGEQFDAICREIPGLAPWIAPEKATATTEPFGIGEIHSVWRNFVADDTPQVRNFFAVGDASARTNPLYGRGCSTGILHAHLLADVLATVDDPMHRALEFERRTHERIRPICEASLREDKNGIRRAEAVMQGLPRDQATNLKKWFGLAFGDALAAAARDEMHVFRGMMRTFNLLENPGEFLNDPAVKRTVFRYMLRGRKRNGQARVQPGPGRNDMLAHVASFQTAS